MSRHHLPAPLREAPPDGRGEKPGVRREDVRCIPRKNYCGALNLCLVRAESDPLGQLASMVLLMPNSSTYNKKQQFKGAALDDAAVDRLIEILQCYRAELRPASNVAPPTVAPTSGAPAHSRCGRPRRIPHPPNHLAATLRRLREEDGRTLREQAAHLKMSVNILCDMENGQRPPNSAWSKLVAATGLDVHDLTALYQTPFIPALQEHAA